MAYMVINTWERYQLRNQIGVELLIATYRTEIEAAKDKEIAALQDVLEKTEKLVNQMKLVYNSPEYQAVWFCYIQALAEIRKVKSSTSPPQTPPAPESSVKTP